MASWGNAFESQAFQAYKVTSMGCNTFNKPFYLEGLSLSIDSDLSLQWKKQSTGTTTATYEGRINSTL